MTSLGSKLEFREVRSRIREVGNSRDACGACDSAMGRAAPQIILFAGGKYRAKLWKSAVQYAPLQGRAGVFWYCRRGGVLLFA